MTVDEARVLLFRERGLGAIREDVLRHILHGIAVGRIALPLPTITKLRDQKILIDLGQDGGGIVLVADAEDVCCEGIGGMCARLASAPASELASKIVWPQVAAGG